MNYKDFKKYFDYKLSFEKQMEDYINEFLNHLQTKELEIVNKNGDDLIKYKESYHHYWFRVSFMDNYSIVTDEKMNISKFELKKNSKKYKFIQYFDDGIVVEICSGNITIPYEYNEKIINEYCKVFFEELNQDIEKILLRIQKDKQEYQESQKKNKDIRNKHTYQNYVYWWDDCSRCFKDYLNYSSGEVIEHTGEYEDCKYSEGTQEILISVTCPKCNGMAGLLHYTKNGYDEKTKPCTKYMFKRYEHDFLTLLGD